MEREDWADLIGPIAKRLLGDPTSATKKEWRYGTRGSLAIDLEKGTFYDFETEQGGGAIDLIARTTGAEPALWLRDNGFDREPRKSNGKARPKREIDKVFPYRNEDGSIAFEVVRFKPKDFRQRRPDGNGGYVWSVKGIRQVPYRLPEMRKVLETADYEPTIYIVEGEKCVDRLRAMGFPATCNAGGAGKWHDDLTEYFRNVNVIVIPDYDPQKKNPVTGEFMVHDDGRPMLPGQDHALAVAQALSAVASNVSVLDIGRLWPAIKPKNDIFDWFEAGLTAADFEDLEKDATPWEPELTLSYPGEIDAGLGEWNAGLDPGRLPPREWLYGTMFCCGYISSIVAAGGTGKSALRLLQFLSMAVGRSLGGSYGQYVFRRSRVLLISLEDDTTELQRRIAAALKYYGVERSELDGWLWCAAPKKIMKLALMDDKKRERKYGELERLIRDAIRRLEKAGMKPDIVSLDPFVKTHALDENSSGDMDFVCDLLAKLCIEFNIAVDSPHHVHKGTIEPGNADAGRGSSGIRDAARLIYTLCPMSEEEAEGFGVALDQRRYYVRLDPAKVNIAAPAAVATWFRLVGVKIDNGDPDGVYKDGDTVQVAVPWSPPSPFGDLTDAMINQILDRIAAGFVEEQGKGLRRYSNAPAAADRAVWPVIKEFASDKTEKECRRIINAWLDSGLLYAGKFNDPARNNRSASGLFVDDTKRPGGATRYD